MTVERLSLARQVDVAIRQLEDELRGMTAGTIVLQIREDAVGKFGVRHLPVVCEATGPEGPGGGMTATQVTALRKMAVEALRHKRCWTHGEISYDFALRRDKVELSVQFESNYNMANLFRLKNKRYDSREEA